MKPPFIPRAEQILSAALSRLLCSDADVAAQLARLAGTVIEIRLLDTPLHVYAAPGAGGVRVFAAHAGEADVRVSGRLRDFIAYARASRRGDPPGPGRIDISGDLAVAQNVQSLLGQLRVDWEELLAGAIGDIPAHQAGRLARALGRAARSAATKIERDVAEFLHDESHLLPQRREVERFGRAVTTLATEVDRLEARLWRQRRRPR